MTFLEYMRAALTEEPTLTENARKVLEARYLKKNEQGECMESPRELFRRVAGTIADVELRYGASETERALWEDRFYRLMTSGAFMPNSPTLMNAGREMGMLSACFVLPVRDSIVDIFNSIKHTALIQKAGGGTGFAFDELRPTGDYIKSSGGTTSGPISFWRAFSEATNAIQQGAFRRGANMGMMYIHHPDILKFLYAKQDLSQFTNYNISVKVTDTWMEEFLADPDSPHVVRNPRTGKASLLPRGLDIMKYTVNDLIDVDCVEPVNARSNERYFRTPRLTGAIPAEHAGRVYTKREIWDIIVQNAWQTGEPGVVFIDRINEFNPTPHVGRIEATNPCGEQPLLPYEACNLGSINLGYFVTNANRPDADVDWEGLAAAIRLSTRYLDNVIDANNYPLPEIERMCQDNRKIGLGVMGFADALYKLNVPYNSDEGIAWGERLMAFCDEEAHASSEQLARERGCFPNWKGSIWHTKYNRMMRNAAVTTVAPTGTISMIANCSGGIEPMFSLAFVRNVLRGQKQGEKPLIEVNETFCDVARSRGFYRDALLERIAEEGTLAPIDNVPEDVKRVFVCAHDITPEWHVQMQAAFQRHCDSSISKTINFPHDATRDDVETIYRLAYELRCKGVTVYRDGCRALQPMARKTSENSSAQATPEADGAETPDASDATDVGMQEQTGRAASEVSVRSARPASESLERKPAAAVLTPRIAPMDLPEIVSGLRIRQMTPFGNMHVKITVDPRTDRELEVFAQLGKGGDVANSDLEAICRMVSLWLRAGGTLRLVIQQLEGIGSSLQIPTRTGRIMSLGDGLAAALKKYIRAKERFGLRNLLLGEIDPAALDNPNYPPHTPENAPLDRTVKRGNGGEPAMGSAAPAPEILRRISAELPRGGASSESPQAIHAGGNGKGPAGGNGNGNGNGRAPSTATVAPPVYRAVRETSATPVAVATLTMTEAFDEPLLLGTEAEEDAACLPEVATVLVPRYFHDAASHYKLRCPECNSPLMLQEGCRKCANPGCGWAAC